MTPLKRHILEAIRSSNDIKTVPQLADIMKTKVNSELLEALYQLKKDRLIVWQTSKFFYLSSRGYEELERVA